MRTKIYQLIFHPVFFTVVLITSILLTYFTGGIGYFFGLFIALIGFWASKFKGSIFGISHPDWAKTIKLAIAFAILIFLVVDGFIQPFLERFIDPIDLTSFDQLRGNFLNYIFFIVIMWLVAGFGEELLYRGYFLKRLAEILGNKNISWLIASILISTLFGIAHLYQGITGVITTGLIGFFLAMIFMKYRTNLILLMLIHGFYDMIGITLIYTNTDKQVSDFFSSLIF